MQKKHVLQDMLEPVISGLGYETVRILTIGQANPTLQIMIDKLDGSDIVVEDCATVSRKISEVLDANEETAETLLTEWHKAVGKIGRAHV